MRYDSSFILILPYFINESIVSITFSRQVRVSIHLKMLHDQNRDVSKKLPKPPLNKMFFFLNSIVVLYHQLKRCRTKVWEPKQTSQSVIDNNNINGITEDPQRHNDCNIIFCNLSCSTYKLPGSNNSPGY